MKDNQQPTVRCPDCGSDLTIDLATGQAFHSQAKAAGEAADLDHLLARLEESKARANEVFQKELGALEDRERLMEERFREAVRRAEQEPVQDPPLRP